MPVRPEPGLAPKYVLALFTRNIHGEWFFTDALGRAGLDFQHAVYDARVRAEADQLAAGEQLGQFGLFDLDAEALRPPPFDREGYERQHRQRWVDTIAENVHRLLRAHGPLILVERVDEVYGAVLGQAWEKHVRAAIKQLHRGGIIDDNGIGQDFWRRPIRLRTPDPAAVNPDTGLGAAGQVPPGDHAGAEAS
jgi:hypothetical protein